MKKEVTFHLVIEVEDDGQLDEIFMKMGILRGYEAAKREGWLRRPDDISTVILGEHIFWHSTWPEE